jgi:ABC-type branched-subunit amino acid transport system ATPase component
VLTATGLSKNFGRDAVLHDATVQVSQAECVVLTGPNGSGKTTLLNLLAGFSEPDQGTITVHAPDGERTFVFPVPWEARAVRQPYCTETMAGLGIIKTWQDLRLFDSVSLRENISVAVPEAMDVSPWTVLFRNSLAHCIDDAALSSADELLKKVGLTSRRFSSAGRVSLGQAKRVGIARAVAAGARLLLLDEPFSGLDASGVRGVVSVLEKLKREMGLALVIVEHLLNLRYLEDLADAVWEIRDGRIGVRRSERTLLRRQVLDASPERAAVSRPRCWAARSDHPVCGSPTDAAPDASADSGERTESILMLCDATVQRGRRLAVGREGRHGEVTGLSLVLRRGETAVIEAPNGWGKSTLVEALAGLIPLSSGRVWLRGTDVTGWKPWVLARAGIRTVRSTNTGFPDLTVRDALLVSSTLTPPHQLRTHIDRPCWTLSGGERQLLALWTAIHATRPGDVLILDEPFAALDEQFLSLVSRLLRTKMRDAALLVCTPDISPQLLDILKGDDDDAKMDFVRSRAMCGALLYRLCRV